MGFLIGAGIVAWLALIFWLITRYIETDEKPYILLAALAIAIALGGLIQLAINEENSGPCLREEVQMHYNPSTKTMMPTTVCVSRGEWVK